MSQVKQLPPPLQPDESKVARIFYRFFSRMERVTYPVKLHKLMVECMVVFLADMLFRYEWGLHYGIQRLTWHYNRQVERKLLQKQKSS